MRILLQRVAEARVEVDGQVTGAIHRGILLLVGFTSGDDAEIFTWMARKCLNLRIFPDDDGKMNRSLLDISGEVLVVSQFTLYGNAYKGHRPSFVQAAPPMEAEAMYDAFISHMASLTPHPVQTGRFGANMQVHLVNDGPVTLWLERGGDGPSHPLA